MIFAYVLACLSAGIPSDEKAALMPDRPICAWEAPEDCAKLASMWASAVMTCNGEQVRPVRKMLLEGQ